MAAKRKEEKPPPPGRAANPHSMMLTPEEAMSEMRCSKATLFKLLKPSPDGEPAEIESFLLAPNARRIPRASVEAYMKRKLDEAKAAAGAA